MCNLLLYLANVIVRVLQVDLFDGNDLFRLIVDGFIDGSKTAGPEFLQEGILTGRVVMR